MSCCAGGGGEDHHRNGPQVRVGLEVGEGFQATAAGQVEVEQDQGGPRRASEATGAAHEPYRLLAVANDVQLHIQMMLGECFPGQQHVPGVVFDQENLGGAEQRGAGHHRIPGPTGSGRQASAAAGKGGEPETASACARASSRLGKVGIRWSIPVTAKMRRTVTAAMTSSTSSPSAWARLCPRTRTLSAAESQNCVRDMSTTSVLCPGAAA